MPPKKTPITTTSPSKSKRSAEDNDEAAPPQLLKRHKSDVSMLEAPLEDEGKADKASSDHNDEPENKDANKSAHPAPKHTTSVTKKPPALKKSTSKVFVPLDSTVPTNTAFPTKLEFTPVAKDDIKIVTWNVSGLTAALKKGFRTYIDAEDADVVCLQEIKVNAHVQAVVDESKYRWRYWGFEEKKGYAGTAVFSKYKPLSVIYGLPGYERASRARVITLEFGTAYLVACYVPNSGQDLSRLGERGVFDGHMEKWLKELEGRGKGVIWTGDLNVAHKENDLAKPKGNEKTAGFTPQERAAFSRILVGSPDYGGPPPLQPLMVDVWRQLHPDAVGRYTYYSYRFQCRTKGIGWRVDYFVVSPALLDRVVECEIRDECYGASDHVPLLCVLKGAL